MSVSRGREILALTLIGAVGLVCAPVALGIFSDPAAGGPLTLSTSTLLAPTNVNAAQANCRTNKGIEVGVGWSASSSSYASGYTVERATSSGGPFSAIASVSINKTTYTDTSGSLAYSTTYYYRVSAVYRSWSAASASDSATTLSKSCQAG